MPFNSAPTDDLLHCVCVAYVLCVDVWLAVFHSWLSRYSVFCTLVAYVYVFVYMCVCVYVCVHVCVHVLVCVCVRVRVCVSICTPTYHRELRRCLLCH